ncbi:MAG: amidohydrolase family protein [Deltaproteobacteria bacterium]|nr:amidohydrolase family protein [Deltaproteobacteria bacterium]
MTAALERVTDGFRVFDAHVHVGRWLTPDFAGRESDLADAAGVLAGAGVTGALVMTTDARDNEGVLAAVRAWQGPLELRFAAWADPADPAALPFLARNAGEVAALKVHASFARLPITDPAFEPFLAHAGRAGLPVVVHCGRWREVAGWEMALEAADRHPEVPFILSHMGGDSPALVLGAAQAVRDRGLANAHLGTESIREYWLVRRALDLVGPEKVLFGSDHNLNHPGAFLAVARALGLDAASEALVLGGNARRLLAGSRRPGGPSAA